MTNIDRIYEEHIRPLSPADQLRLASRIMAAAAASAEASAAPPAAPGDDPDDSGKELRSEWVKSTLQGGSRST